MSNYSFPMADSEFERLIGNHDAFAIGSSREAFNVLGNNSVIIKKQRIPFPGCNMMEWFIWNAAKDSSLASLFGQCHAISDTGRFLIMERLDTIDPPDLPQLPHVPQWFTDRKPSAFGRAANGTIKIRDYGMIKLAMILDTRVYPLA